MVTAQEVEIATAEELLDAPDAGRCELVAGELVMMSPTGFEHGVVAGRIYGYLFIYVQQNRLGLVTAAETGFQIGRNPDTVRAPDVGFVKAERVPLQRTQGFFQGAPDLAVEVVSLSDRAGDLLAKVRDWLAAGCQSVWIVDPTSQTISIYRGAHEPAMLANADELADDAVVPGFRLPVAQVF